MRSENTNIQDGQVVSSQSANSIQPRGIEVTYIALLLGTVAMAAGGCAPSELGNLSSQNTNEVTDVVAKQSFAAELRGACGEGGLTASGNLRLLRRPYLQKVTSNSAEILWTTDAVTDVSVSLRIAGDPKSEPREVLAQEDTQAQRTGFTQQVVRFSDLLPSQIYCYEIISKDETWLSSTGFRTAPEKDSDEAIRIVVMGDLGTQTSDQLAILDQLEQVDFDLALVAGDLAYEKGTLSDHENNFFAVYQDLLSYVPFFPISGNHDYAQDGAVFREVFSLFENGGEQGRERWYSFDWGPVHIVALDTEKVGDAQARWLDADLAATDQDWRIVFMHRPLYSSGSHGGLVAAQEQFGPLLTKHNVQLVLAGHDHNYERTEKIDGVTYVVTGSAGRGTRPVSKSEFTEYSEAVAHFSYIRIEGNVLKLNAIDGTGRDFDSVVIER